MSLKQVSNPHSMSVNLVAQGKNLHIFDFCCNLTKYFTYVST